MPHPLADAVRIAKHDLGKYIAFQLRWLTPDASAEERLEALRADVLATRRGPDSVEDAFQIWGRLRPTLAGLGDDPDLAAIEARMAALAARRAGLVSGALDEAALDAAADDARAVARHLSDLYKRLRSA